MKTFRLKRLFLAGTTLLFVISILAAGCDNDNNGGGETFGPVISSTIPSEVEPIPTETNTRGIESGLNNNDFDFFSWQAFIALNWPAAASGNPSNAPIGSDPEALRVWEHYADGGDPFSTDEEVEYTGSKKFRIG